MRQCKLILSFPLHILSSLVGLCSRCSRNTCCWAVLSIYTCTFLCRAIKFVAVEVYFIFSQFISPVVVCHSSRSARDISKLFLQWNPDFSRLQGKRKLVRDIGTKIRSKITVKRTAKGNDFWFELSGFLRNQGFGKSESLCSVCRNCCFARVYFIGSTWNYFLFAYFWLFYLCIHFLSS